MTIRSARSAALVVALLACAAPARATVGGPTRLEVLGWDSATQRIYVHSVPESGAVKTDTLRDRVHGPITRHQVRARWWVTPGEFEFTTYDRPDVVLRSVHAVPGRAERLLVFAFIGDPFEGGYETQVAILVTRPADVKREVR